MSDDRSSSCPDLPSTLVSDLAGLESRIRLVVELLVLELKIPKILAEQVVVLGIQLGLEASIVFLKDDGNYRGVKMLHEMAGVVREVGLASVLKKEILKPK